MSGSQTVGDVFPQRLNDFIALAERAVSRLDRSQSTDDLFAAVLATSHCADWYSWHVEGRKLNDAARAAFAARYPAWDILRQLGNGAKHAKSRHIEPDNLKPIDVKWEQPDAWDHVGNERTYWVVEHQGEGRSVYTLCRTFLDELKADVAARSSAP